MTRLKELRKEKNITLVDIEKQTGIKRSTYSDYENGIVKTGKIENWEKLADYFDVPVSYLMGLSNSKYIDGDTNTFTNMDNSPDMMQQAKLADTQKAAVAFNRVLFWLDNDVLAEHTEKPVKSEKVHNKDKELIALIKDTFEYMREDFLGGINFTISKPQKYIDGIEYYKRNFIMMQEFNKLNEDDKLDLMLSIKRLQQKELENKEQNKKASDDKPETN
ncbi:helix-turn-helix transcriptional regulator [Leuconostoc gelidum subsp. aenigmaticum]|nr:helix-turn-helix transcriptional regulator [Leuconostoc gelidum subsp. aenigmaticum]